MSKEHLKERETKPGIEAPPIAPGLVRLSEKSDETAPGARRRSYEAPCILGEVTLESGGPVLQASVGDNMTGTQTTGQGVDEYNTGPGSGFNVDWDE